MIAPLRTRHLGMTLALALVVPPIVILALTTRPETAVTDPVPPALATSPAPAHGDFRTFDFARVPVAVTLAADEGGRRATVRPTGDLVAPDVLVYWKVGDAADATASLPTGARLLGVWEGRATSWPLPPGAGTMWLYSLGHQQVLDHLALPAGRGAP